MAPRESWSGAGNAKPEDFLNSLRDGDASSRSNRTVDRVSRASGAVPQR
jgi:hypothetical protein